VTGREIREALDRSGVLPSRQLGQNFLTDPNMARWIVAQLDAGPDDTVVEVGPGTGSLTTHLAGRVRKLVLVEFDHRLAALLREHYAGQAVEVIHADAAKLDPRFLFGSKPVKFLGNLPYSSGGAILRNFLSHPHPFERAVVMLQKEVVERMAAAPGSKDYGILSLRIQADWTVESLRSVPPEAFHPRPAVDSTVALLRPRGDLPPFDRALFDGMVRSGFAQRRKQLRRQLPAGIDWERTADTLGLQRTARAEELSLTDWVRLARACDPHPLKDLPQHPGERLDVTDAGDVVTGTATREEIHARGLLHRAIHVMVFNRRGEVLLQKRSMAKDSHPGAWGSSVSGHVDAGETYDEAAVRELAEEMGIRVERPPEEIARIQAGAATEGEHVRVYRVRHDGKVRFPAAEVDTALWLPVEVLDAWIKAAPCEFTPGFLTCWRESATSRAT
jgi:16S rRNA (adenine1518-N6/adenine1519-N6)-dimethyltransferase